MEKGKSATEGFLPVNETKAKHGIQQTIPALSTLPERSILPRSKLLLHFTSAPSLLQWATTDID
jgi:hypothetical protein